MKPGAPGVEVAFVDPSHDCWEALVRDAGNACFLHSSRFLAYHGGRFDESIAVLLGRSGEPMAGVRYVEVGGRAHSHPGATFGGILYRAGMRSTDVVTSTKGLLHALRDADISTIRLRPMPLLMRPRKDESDLYAITRLGGNLVRRELSTILPLRAGPSIRRSRRQQIAKATNAGITVVESLEPGSFHDILTGALSRHSAVPVHDVAELHDLRSRLPDEIRLFTAHVGTANPVAGALIFDFGGVVHTQYLAATDEGRVVGALDLIIHHLATEIYADRDYLSFGISTEDGGSVLNEGLANYKDSFGGLGQAIDTYEIAL